MPLVDKLWFLNHFSVFVSLPPFVVFIFPLLLLQTAEWNLLAKENCKPTSNEGKLQTLSTSILIEWNFLEKDTERLCHLQQKMNLMKSRMTPKHQRKPLHCIQPSRSLKVIFGKDSMLSLQHFFGARRTPVISTGSLRLDLALGNGGLPKGSTVEISGQEASGKTTLALHVIREAQKLGDVLMDIVWSIVLSD